MPTPKPTRGSQEWLDRWKRACLAQQADPTALPALAVDLPDLMVLLALADQQLKRASLEERDIDIDDGC
jgi:hypothetical protein